MIRINTLDVTPIDLARAFALIALISTWPVLAAPSITSVSGTVVNRSTLVISGAAFGQKAVAGPLVFDDFESGQVGAIIAGNAPTVRSLSPTWVWDDFSSGSNRPQYSNLVVRPHSSRSSRHVYGGAANYNASLELFYDVLNSGGEVYFSFWRYHDQTSAAWSRNVKPWTAYGSSGDSITPSAYVGWGSPSAGDGELRNAVQDSGVNEITLWSGPQLNEVEGEWIRMEVYLKQSSPGEPDGAWQVTVHRSRSPSITTVMDRPTYETRGTSNYWRRWVFGSYHATDNPSTATAEVYLDDFHFDRTRARVELGDAPQWSQCTRREIQIARSWSPEQVSISVNQGSFPASQKAYLYVVDPQGAVNAQGYPVTIGESEVAPAPPKDVIVD